MYAVVPGTSEEKLRKVGGYSTSRHNELSDGLRNYVRTPVTCLLLLRPGIAVKTARPLGGGEALLCESESDRNSEVERGPRGALRLRHVMLRGVLLGHIRVRLIRVRRWARERALVRRRLLLLRGVLGLRLRLGLGLLVC